MQIAKLRHQRGCDEKRKKTKRLMEDDWMTQKKFGKTSAVYLGLLTWSCTFEGIAPFARVQQMPKSSKMSQLLKQFQNLSAKNRSNFLTAKLSLSDSSWPKICLVIQNFDFFLRFLLFTLLKQLSKQIDVFLFSKDHSCISACKINQSSV